MCGKLRIRFRALFQSARLELGAILKKAGGELELLTDHQDMHLFIERLRDKWRHFNGE